MNNKELLMKAIEREQTYCDKQQVGTEEYQESFDRLMRLRKELADLEKAEAEIELKTQEAANAKKDRRVKNGIEIGKVVGTGIVMPCIGLVAVLAFEKNDSFTTSMKRVVDCFIPKRIN